MNILPLRRPLCRLSLWAGVLTLATAATLRGNENGSDVSLQRPGYGAITLRSPSSPPSDPMSADLRASDSLGPGDTRSLPRSSGRSAAMPLVTIGSSLAVVLGLFAALVWVSKKTGVSASRGGVIPEEALRLLGQKSLGALGSIALVRCGRSVLVVGISAAGMQRLSEITDDEQIRSLEALCLGDSVASFQAVMGDSPMEGAVGGFVDGPLARTHDRKKLFADR